MKKKLMSILLATLFAILFSSAVPILAPSAVAWDDPTEGEECGPAGFEYDLTQVGGGLFKCLRFKQGDFYLDLTKRSSMTENYRGETFKGVKCSKVGSWGYDYLAYDFLQCANVNGSLKFTTMTVDRPSGIPTRIQTVSPAIVSGAKCSKAGEIKSSSGKKLVCAKSKGKLIWISMNTAPSSKPTTSPTPKCEPSSTLVTVGFPPGGALKSDGTLIPGYSAQELVLENLSDCNVVVSVSTGADCSFPQKIFNEDVVPIQAIIQLSKREKLSVRLNQFPEALLLCKNLTGSKSIPRYFQTNEKPTLIVVSSS